MTKRAVIPRRDACGRRLLGVAFAFLRPRSRGRLLRHRRLLVRVDLRAHLQRRVRSRLLRRRLLRRAVGTTGDVSLSLPWRTRGFGRQREGLSSASAPDRHPRAVATHRNVRYRHIMNARTKKVLEEARQLFADDRSLLAAALDASLEPTSSTESDESVTDQAWTAEIERRAEQVLSGASRGRPADEVFADLRARLATRSR